MVEQIKELGTEAQLWHAYPTQFPPLLLMIPLYDTFAQVILRHSCWWHFILVASDASRRQNITAKCMFFCLSSLTSPSAMILNLSSQGSCFVDESLGTVLHFHWLWFSLMVSIFDPQGLQKEKSKRAELPWGTYEALFRETLCCCHNL